MWDAVIAGAAASGLSLAFELGVSNWPRRRVLIVDDDSQQVTARHGVPEVSGPLQFTPGRSQQHLRVVNVVPGGAAGRRRAGGSTVSFS